MRQGLPPNRQDNSHCDVGVTSHFRIIVATTLPVLNNVRSPAVRFGDDSYDGQF
jgi:hypothetical protein